MVASGRYRSLFCNDLILALILSDIGFPIKLIAASGRYRSLFGNDLILALILSAIGFPIKLIVASGRYRSLFCNTPFRTVRRQSRKTIEPGSALGAFSSK